jgi:hypothetical protein
MHSFETASLTFFKWTHYVFLAAMWHLTITGIAEHNDRMRVSSYVLLPFTALLLWWLSTFKRVTVRDSSLTVCGSSQEVRLTMDMVRQVSEHPWNRGYSHVTIVFKSRTEFGRSIRLKTRSLHECERLAKSLQEAVAARGA